MPQNTKMFSFDFTTSSSTKESAAAADESHAQEEEEEEKVNDKLLLCQGERVRIEMKNPLLFKAEWISFGTKKKMKKRTVPDINFEIMRNDDLSSNNELVQALTNQSDLIPFVYEGGAKTWECSIDLANYLFEHPELVKSKNVTELGCGSSLPGITSLLLDAQHVCFQDYNVDVIRFVTVPNVLLNANPSEGEGDQGEFEVEIPVGANLGPSSFYAGDWSLLLQVMPGNQDVILTSESIYNLDTIPSLLLLMQKLLAPNGFVLCAAKHMYFGCSGSLQLFKSMATQQGFIIEELFVHSAGIRREILKLYLVPSL